MSSNGHLPARAIYGTIGSGIPIFRLPEFTEWLKGLNDKSRLQIEARILRVQDHRHFGKVRLLGDGLAEMKWKSGWRVYFSHVLLENGEAVLLILGGGKNGQSKDIKKSRVLLERYKADQN